jgi:hypothetical protein
MRSAASLLRLLIEFVFILLGAFILRIALTGRYFFDRRAPLWIIVGILLTLAGARGLWQARRASASLEDRIRGVALTLVGLMMLGVAALPFPYEGILMAIAGGALIFRGLGSALIVLRSPH